MIEEAQPLSNRNPVVEHSRQPDATDTSPASSLMCEDENPKRGKNLKEHAKEANRFWQDTWVSEVLSCIVALSALIGMAVMLKIRQERPMPHWPSGITLNTAVAVFSAIIKAAMIMPVGEGISQLKFLWFRKTRTLADLEDFDNASRGPWGSFLFMIQPKAHYLATFGAFITVAALAVDPFSQQILQYYSCSTMAPGISARIPRNNQFTADIVSSRPAGGQISLDEKMAGAIWLGVLQPPQNVSSQVNVQCPSGNCTFPADAGASYETIAICSSCDDISSQIVDYNASVVDGVTGSKTSEMLLYTLPESSKLANDSVYIGGSTVFESRIANTSDLFAFESLMFRQKDFSCNSRDPKSVCRMKPFATHCSLNPCVQSYTATIKDFKFDEKVVSSTNMVYDAYSHGTLGSFSLVANSTIRDGIRHECIKTDRHTLENTIPLTWNNTIVLNTHLRNITQWTSRECFFEFDITSQAISNFLTDMYTRKYLVEQDDFSTTLGDLWIKRFYQRGTANLTTATEYMDGLAIAISAQMRRDQDPTRDALGTVFTQHTCVRIKWAWISLPASLVLMAILFLIGTMWSSSAQAWHGMWKSSALALVFASIESKSLLYEGVLERKSQIDNTADGIKVKFIETERGWGFVKH